MENLDLIISNLQLLPTAELLLLAQQPETIQAAVIPHIQAELRKRGKEQAAIELAEYDANKAKPLAQLSEDELKEHVQQRIASGEPIESIRIDLQDNGIDLFDIAFEKIEAEAEKIDFINNLKEFGKDEQAIDKQLQITYGITEDETDKLKERRKSKGMWNLFIGYPLAGLALMLAIASITTGHLFVKSFALFSVGVWRIIEGHKLLK
jgi:hypothetical protein